MVYTKQHNLAQTLLGGYIDMELRQIEYFVAITKYKNYTKAANELYVSQPTISVAIQKLENEIGVRLLERDNKGITITEEGEVFLKYAEKILQDIQHLVAVMTDLQPSTKKLLKVAFPSTVGSWLWRELLYGFSEKYIDIELDITDCGTLDIIKLLKNQDVDIGYGVIELVVDEDIECRTIRDGELKIILPTTHPFAQMSLVPIAMLENQLVIMYNKGSTYTEKLLLENMEKLDIKPKIHYVKEQSSVFNMVLQECGIAVVLDDQVSIIKDNQQMVSRGFVEPILFETGLLWNKNKFLSSSTRKFQKFVEDCYNLTIK